MSNLRAAVYNKGAVAAAVFDLELRALTGGKKDFFDVLQGLKDEFGGTGHGFTLDDVQRLTEQAAGDKPGAKERIAKLFNDHLRDRKPFDLSASLNSVGYQFVSKHDGFSPESIPLGAIGVTSDSAGELQVADVALMGKPKATTLPSLGLSLTPKDAGVLEIGSVVEGGAAWKAGLSEFAGSTPKDVSVQSDGSKITGLTFTFEQKDAFSGQTVSRSVTVTPETPSRTVLEEVPSPSGEQLARRAEWLNPT